MPSSVQEDLTSKLLVDGSGVCDLSPDGRPHRTEELAEGPGEVEGAVAGDAGTHASQLLLLSGLVLDTARHVRLGL